MRTNTLLLCLAVVLVRVCCALGSMSYHFEGMGIHDRGTWNYVSVEFTIFGAERPLDLNTGQSYDAHYTAIYTTTSGDLGFNTNDNFKGTGTVTVAEVVSDEEYEIAFSFPQNPLPGAWSPERSSITFTKWPSEELTGRWSASPYSFSRNATLSIMTHEIVSADKLYWSDWGIDKIQRANLDGSAIQDVVVEGYASIAIDNVMRMLYWTEWSTPAVRRSALDGTSVCDLVTDGLLSPSGIALDPSEGKMYWCDRGANKIQRANLDGTMIEDVLSFGLNMPRDLAFESNTRKLYWLSDGDLVLRRCNTDGTEVEDLSSLGISHPSGLALDPSREKVYWLDWTNGTVCRANLDGTSAELVLDNLELPSGLAIDSVRQHVYWTSQQTDRIRRANLDGSQITDIVTKGLSSPFRLALYRSFGATPW